MQHTVKPQKNSGAPQGQSLIITAITIFALAGAILGFSVGAITHPHTTQQPTADKGPDKKPTSAAVVPSPTPSPTVVTTIKAEPLSCPGMPLDTDVTGTVYHLIVSAIDKIHEKDPCGASVATKPTTNPNTTCRIWLTQKKDETEEKKDVSDDINAVSTALRSSNKPLNFSAVFTHEIPDGLVFTGSTGSTSSQPCTKEALGTGTGVGAQWSFTLSPTLSAGTYMLVGLTWNETYYNWSYRQVVKK